MTLSLLPSTPGMQNIKAYAIGRAPKGVPVWSYKRVHMMHNDIVIDNIESQLYRISRFTLLSIWLCMRMCMCICMCTPKDPEERDLHAHVLVDVFAA